MGALGSHRGQPVLAHARLVLGIGGGVAAGRCARGVLSDLQARHRRCQHIEAWCQHTEAPHAPCSKSRTASGPRTEEVPTTSSSQTYLMASVGIQALVSICASGTTNRKNRDHDWHSVVVPVHTGGGEGAGGGLATCMQWQHNASGTYTGIPGVARSRCRPSS